MVHQFLTYKLVSDLQVSFGAAGSHPAAPIYSCEAGAAPLSGVDERHVNDMRQIALFGASQWSTSCR